MTQRQRPRIVKPRTARQRAHIKRYGQNPASKIHIMPADGGLPSDSWWTRVDRQGFTRTAEAESQRMRLSKFGTVKNPFFGDEA